jgi:two-component system cell cycle sensor histidine kinase/response regulator CckA
MLRDEPDLAQAEAVEYVDEIIRAANRASDLTRQLLAFSRRQSAQPRPLDLNELVRHTSGMLRRVIGEDIQLATDLHAEESQIFADPSQIDQVLMNLVVNARDAMPNGGEIRISTELRYPTVELCVSDRGSGIPPEVMAKMFEPFFTTKESGKGTGLGLSLVHAIITQAGGKVDVETALGKGTTFRIRFPLHWGEAADADAAGSERDLPRGRETILVVEDEEPLRSLIRRLLVRGGYRVVEAADGDEAVALAKASKVPIDLLLTDVMLPHRNGRDVAQAVASAYPNVRILFMSGYGENTPPGAARLEKPFGPSKLATTVRELLDQR